MQIRPTAFTIGLIIHFSIALFYVYTKYGIDSFFSYILVFQCVYRIVFLHLVYRIHHGRKYYCKYA